MGEESKVIIETANNNKAKQKSEELVRKASPTYIITMIISIPIAFLIVIILDKLFPSFFAEIQFDENSFISIIKAQLNNGIAIALAIVPVIHIFILILIGFYRFKDVRFLNTIKNTLGNYGLIILITLLPYINDEFEKIIKVAFNLC